MAGLRRIVKTFLALLAGVGLAIGAVLLWRRRGGNRNEALRRAVTETKEAIEEARQVAVVEVSAARNKELELKRRLNKIMAKHTGQTIERIEQDLVANDVRLKRRLKGVTKMTDKRRRREELLKLYQEVR